MCIESRFFPASRSERGKKEHTNILKKMKIISFHICESLSLGIIFFDNNFDNFFLGDNFKQQAIVLIYNSKSHFSINILCGLFTLTLEKG